jgi:hypothetical protein
VVADKTIIVLDEGYNFQGTADYQEQVLDQWKFHEFQSIHNFAREHHYSIHYIGYNENGQQLAFSFKELK